MKCDMNCFNCQFSDCIKDIQPERDRREYMKNYYKENKEIIAKQHKQWQEENREHYLQYRREYRAKKKAERVS